MSIYYQIILSNSDSLESQILPLNNVNEACDLADRMRYFFTGTSIEVSLLEVSENNFETERENITKRTMNF